MNTIEEKVRAATRAAADLVADGSATPLDLSRRRTRPSRPWRPSWHDGRLGMPLVPLAAAAAVLAIAVAAIAIPRSLNSGLRPGSRQHEAVATTALLPRYLMTVHTWGFWRLDVRNTLTGSLTAGITAPMGYSWYAVAAQGLRTFIASKTLNGGRMTSYFYRLVIGGHGTVASINRVGRGVPGVVDAASVTPDGRYIAYVAWPDYDSDGSYAERVVLASLSSGKVVASWPVPAYDSVASLSIDAGGNALAISAYSYGVGLANIERGILTQWTSVLRPATSGTPIDRLPRLLPQAGTLALSPDGRTLYEFLQAGKVSASPQRDQNLVTFDLAAVNARTGAVVSVLHTWRAVWSTFIPQLALGPSGVYLLIADGVRLALIATATGQYTALPGTAPEIHEVEYGLGKMPTTQGFDIDPLAW
jgi:hypothetical protein